MKKQLITGFCLLLLLPNAFAQEQKLHLGLEAGIVRGSLKVPAVDPTSSFFRGEVQSSLGLRMGANIRYQIKPQLSFKTGIYFTQKGAGTIFQPSPFGGGGILVLPNEMANFNFVQLPLLLRFHPPIINGFYLGMGPYIGILVAHPHKGFKNSPSFRPGNTFDLGFGASIGQEIPLHNYNYLAFELSFELGTHDISGFSDFRLNNGNMFPRALNFGVSYLFVPR